MVERGGGHGRRLVGVAGTLGMRLGAAVEQIVITLLLTNLTALTAFGQYGAGLAAGMVATSVLGLGIPSWLLRLPAEISRGETTVRVSSLLRLGLLAAVLGAVVAVLAASGLRPGQMGQAAALAAATGVLVESFSLVVQNMLFGRLRHQQAVALQLLSRVPPMIGIGLAWQLGASVFGGLVVGYLVTLVGLLVLARELWRGPWDLWASTRGGRSYWKASVWAMLQQLDVVIITSLLGRAPAGGYAAAFRIASPVHLVTGLLNAMYVPRLSAESDPAARARGGRRLVLAGSGYALALVALSPLVAWLAPMVVGEQYRPYRMLFAILVINSAISVVNQLLTTWLYADGRAEAVARASRVATICGLLAMVLLAWTTGEVRWVAVACAGIQVLLLVQLVTVRRHFSGARG